MKKIIKKGNFKIKKNDNSNKNIGKENVTRKPKKNKKKSILTILLYIFDAGMLLMAVFFIYVVLTAPNFDPERLYDKQVSMLYAKNGVEFASVGSSNRELITYDQLPETFIDALVATEDSRFFEHNGFDLPRFLVASVKQVLTHSGGGASTLTMQVSKNKLTSTEASGIEGIVRKFQDIYISVFKMEKKYTKQEIMEFYVNSNYLGGNAWGVEAASKQYFNKTVSELTLPEAAMIVGIFNAPGSYDPFIAPDKCEQRRLIVLSLMKRHGYITEEEYNDAKEMTVSKILVNANAKSNSDYQSFINTVVEEVKDKTGKNPYTTSMKIYTTMDADQQEYIEKLMRGKLDGYTWENDKVQGSVAVIDSSDGSISAIGAGRNRGELDQNYATMISRQIGSTAKPLYDYGPAIEFLGWGSSTQIIDEPWAYSGTNTYIKNWNGTYSGFTNVKEAIIDSKNIPALKTFQSVPNNKIYKYVTSLGLHPEADGNVVHESHALGGYTGENPLSMAAAYNAYSSNGYYTEPYSFTKIVYTDSDETYTYKPTKKKVVSDETSYIMSRILIDTAQSYSSYYKYINGVTYAAKSGTSNLTDATIKQFNLPSNAVADLWFAGYNGEYAIAVWYGYDDLTIGYNTFGSKQNNRLFQAAAKGVFKKSLDTTMPEDVTEVTLESETNLLASEYTPDNMKVSGIYKKGTEPTEVSTRFKELNNVTNLKATAGDGDVTLSWTKVDTPDAISETYLQTMYNKLFTDSSMRNTYLNKRLSYNNNYMGTITYDIYQKNTDGSLKYLTTTSDNKIKVSSSDGNTTYVVKTSYTIFKANASAGTSVSLKTTGTGINITIPSMISFKIGTDIVADDIKKNITVTENSTNVSSSNIKIETDITNIDTSVTGNTNINVKVTYKDQTKEGTITIRITN